MEILQLLSTFIKQNKTIYSFYWIISLAFPMEKILVPHLFGNILTNITDNKPINVLKWSVIRLMTVWVLIQCLFVLSYKLDSYLVPRLQTYIRNILLDKFIDGNDENFEELEIGNIITKIIKLPTSIKDLFYLFKIELTSDIVVILGSLVYFAYIHPILGIKYLIDIAIFVYLSNSMYMNCIKKSMSKERIFDKMHDDIQDVLQNLSSIYTNNKSDQEKSFLNKKQKGYEKEYANDMGCVFRYRIMYSFLFMFVFLGMGTLSYILFQNKEITRNVLISLLIVILSVSGKFLNFIWKIKEIMSSLGVLYEINRFTKNIDNKETRKQLINNADIPYRYDNLEHYDIDINNLKYIVNVNNKKQIILNNISLYIPENQTVLILGPVGSGKSSLMKILIGLKTQTSGDIYIGGSNYDNISNSVIRDKYITYVPQNSTLFNRTLWDNIMYGVNSDYDQNDVIKILDDMELHDISKFVSENINKNVGKQGDKISGGQRQIVCLLRAILKQTPIVILDEPTSSLDSNTKQQVLRMIEYISKQKTLIIVTHDNDLMPYANRVIYMDNGKIKREY